jgi:dinuclear metal center YbgI/SA1388 family protein
MIKPIDLAARCDDALEAGRFNDYCPNGLQVEGDRPIRRLVTGVTASQRLIDAAIAADADAILVHHGFFWKGESQPLVGTKGQRIRALHRAGISLLVYHLPLDAHPELGNNRQLASVLGLENPRPSACGDELLWLGELPQPLLGSDLVDLVAGKLQREPLHIAVLDRPLRQLAWCTGAAQGAIERAAAIGADCYLSGEISEATVHLARELGIDYMAAGHHATERYGVQALGQWLGDTLEIEHLYIEIDNPA